MARPKKDQPISENAVELKKIRESLGMTQLELAVALGVDPTTISRCERGISELSLTLKQTKVLCKLTGKPLEELPDYLGKAPELCLNA